MSRAEELWERLVRAALRRQRSDAGDAGAYGRADGGIGANVPSYLANNRDIDDILRAADEIQDEDPNVARILCDHAYWLAQNLDRNSEGSGVLQFKTGLISVIKQQLEKREVGSIDRSQDFARLQKFYKQYRERNNFVNLREEVMQLRESGVFSGNLGELERETVNRKRVFATLKVLGTVLEQLTKEVSPEEAERLLIPEEMDSSRSKEKMKKIFQLFDVNQDGGLNRDEMAALVVATNPRIKFSDEQINAILDEVFRSYGKFIIGGKGVTFEGLLFTYEDGAGDIDRDFNTLGLKLEPGTDGDIWDLLDDLSVSIHKLNSKVQRQDNHTLKITSTRSKEKVKKIFQLFDVNQDGGLNRDEMAALVVATNPRIKFSDEQINAILDEVFRSYGKFIIGEKGVTFEGLLLTYEDGAGDVDRDFNTLGLKLGPGTDGDICDLLDDLNVSIHKLNSRVQRQDNHMLKITSTDSEIFDKRVFWEELDDDYADFVKEWGVLRSRADATNSREEAFDRYLAMGRILYDHHLYIEAFISFERACELQPTHVIPHFRMGNCLYQLARHREAKEMFMQALKVAEADRNKWDYLFAPIYVNLGIVLQGERMFLGACQHFREAAFLCPAHYRAWKFLGSALLLVGEYEEAIMALEKAIYLKNDLVDAHYMMASALFAMGDEDKAINQLQKAIDLNSFNVDALCNIGEVYMEKGEYHRASKIFTVVLTVRPNDWKVQLCKVVSLFGSGGTEEAKKALKEALKTANRVELHDRLVYLRQLQKRRLKGYRNDDGEEVYITVEPSKFKTTDETTTTRSELSNALDMRAFQKTTRLNRCDVELIKKQMNDNYVPVSYPGNMFEKYVGKGALEEILRELLSFMKPEFFVEAVKAINQKILCVLDESELGKVDLGLFFAVIAPLCGGLPDKRKRLAYYALLWRPGNEADTKLRKADAQRYIKLLRTIYIPSHDVRETSKTINEETDTSMISLTEFFALFDDPQCGFGIMSTLLKLETRDGHRNGSYICASCRRAIIGSRFKEMKSHFSLCSHCYSGGKIPTTCNQEEYTFKEYDAATE